MRSIYPKRFIWNPLILAWWASSVSSVVPKTPARGVKSRREISHFEFCLRSWLRDGFTKSRVSTKGRGPGFWTGFNDYMQTRMLDRHVYHQRQHCAICIIFVWFASYSVYLYFYIYFECFSSFYLTTDTVAWYWGINCKMWTVLYTRLVYSILPK